MRPALAAPIAAFLLAAIAQPGAARSPGAEAEPAGAGKRQCFWASQVSGFAADDDRVVNLRVGVRDVWRLDMLGPCMDIDWSQAIAVRARGGSSMICSGLDAELITPSTIGPQRCAVRAVRKLTPAEVAALPKGARP